MKYALLIYHDEGQQAAPESPEAQETFNAYMKFTESINERGINLGGEALHGTDNATTVRVREGETLTTDGPFAETKEALAGLYIIEVPDLDAAIAVAAELPGSWYGSVEVRPVYQWENDVAE
ncbi:MAG TPA: YciI family protein [Acidimicrobiia bacterium]|jgi:hypothetical protein|nr:YciI family protein [Acidimicrobiia bacterium]